MHLKSLNSVAGNYLLLGRSSIEKFRLRVKINAQADYAVG